jgi:hypothetical protein
MQGNARRQARAIAIAKEQDDRVRKIGILALAITMAATCIYGLIALVY